MHLHKIQLKELLMHWKKKKFTILDTTGQPRYGIKI